MFYGKVIGTVWSTVKWPQVQGLKLLLVRPYTLADLASSSAAESSAPAAATSGSTPAAPTHDAVVCADVLDAGVGDEVVIAYGHAARVAISEALGESDKPPYPIDAAVVMIVDGKNVAV